MKKYEFRELKGDEIFEPSDICVSVPFTQAGFYGDWQKTLGRTVRRFLINKNGETVTYFQLVKYPLIFKKSYLYIPYGPVTKDFSEDLLKSLKEELKKIAKSENAVFVRLDFTPAIHNDSHTKTLSKIFYKAPIYTYKAAYFQPRAEWFLDLTKTEDEILKEMHEKTRYSIRLAEKKGIKIEIISSDFTQYFETFYEIMSTTSLRNGFHLHSREYYKKVFQNLKSENSYLSISKFDDKILSIYLVIHYGGIANYVYGCSSNEHRELAPTYLAHWKAIQHSKSLGATAYNFGGISFGEVYKKINMDSLTTFKKKFGGYEVIHSDFYDVIVEPFWYHLYNFRKLIKNK